MVGEGYTEVFKIAAVKKVTQEGYKLLMSKNGLGSPHRSLSSWKARYGEAANEYQAGKAKSMN